MRKIERIFHHYELWEDYHNGMYKADIENREDNILKASELLKNTDLLFETMSKVTKDWKHASEVNMSNTSCNRQAWLGQAACNYLHDASESETRQAWWLLTEEERIEANQIADMIIDRWEKKHETRDGYFSIECYARANNLDI